MTKNTVLLAVTLTALSTLAQPQPSPVSTPAYPPPTTANTNQFGTPGGATFSNQAGQSFSAEQLASQLQNLRTAVEQTLPTLAAFNQSYSNSVSGGTDGTVSGLLSRALNRDQPNNPAPAGQTSLTFSNLVGALANLLSTNHTGATTMPQNTIRDLEALQNSLQPVVPILDRLNVSTLASGQFATPYNTAPLSTNALTPTGR